MKRRIELKPEHPPVRVNSLDPNTYLFRPKPSPPTPAEDRIIRMFEGGTGLASIVRKTHASPGLLIRILHLDDHQAAEVQNAFAALRVVDEDARRAL